MQYFPVFLRLSDRQVLVVGGGDVACRKVDLLLRANANITVISKELHPHLAGYVDAERIRYIHKHYEQSDLDGFDQIWATTDQRDVNHQIYTDATARGLWVNTVDDPQYCHFITPSMVDRSPIQVAISSGGASPVLVRYIRENLETILPQNLSLLAEFSGKQRNRIKQYYSTVDERRKFWERFFRSPELENITCESELENIFQNHLKNNNSEEQSIIYIQVGKDPELLTIKALRLMQQSEFILYGDDCADIFVDLCRRDADREKTADKLLWSRAGALAKSGQRVVILSTKALDEHGIKVPDAISSGIIFLSAQDAC
ncbi:siroheme synthase [Vibrio albus]|uniref:precorrin-2 dehydrogenase n=1 Tax=Vibrio albus TaxID=2200953 RepID=A0A2U3B6U6_9VIBR|nr:NAD(P)-dependent oxidoreductase [Vibrio albus]PWI32510.1 siroheme synthase [Vibrio albus]